MKFSYFVSAFLATLVVASPRDDHRAQVAANRVQEVAQRSNVYELSPRVDVPNEDTDEYKAASKAHTPLVNGNFYWFWLQWPRDPIGDGDGESAAEIKALRDALGFNHVGVVVGQIKETPKGKGKNAVLKRDFVAELHHMIEIKDTDKTGIIQRNYGWKKDSDKVLVWGGETTSSKAAAAKKFAKAWTDVEAQKTYNVKTNNCDTFAKAVKGKL
ncbi:hypothetical protein B0H66DRAFT_347666 [Apodospora peruviana]|uniref:Uncharacterized protein n=1 Tax=Apodospora peruviana TaxID=516989 RepID=A0AAE0M1J4_9PEZI|nr:hypothetical protein B0H66DRAFT_347666 [Apodospora peruviana]